MSDKFPKAGTIVPSEEIIVGQTIVEIRSMTKAEKDLEGWDDWNDPTPAIVLTNGVVLYPSRDPEGNGAGAMFGVNGSDPFNLIPPK